MEERPASALPSGSSYQIASGFDKSCSISTGTMQTWWTYSPHWWFGFYLGGVTAQHGYVAPPPYYQFVDSGCL